MKNTFLLFAVISLHVFCGCGSKKTSDDSAMKAPEGYMTIDLSAQNLAILLNVPDSTVAPLQVSENAQGGADVKVGKNFQLSISEGPGDITLKKNDITTDALRKFVRYVSEDEHSLIWEWQMDGMESEFHFYTIVKAGEKSFEVHDIEGEVFSEKSAMQMLDAAKSIRLKAPKES